MKLSVRGKGGVIAVKGSTLNCSRFSGNKTSNSQSVTEHYICIVKKQIPYLLSSVNVAQVNVGDSIGMAVARTAVRSSYTPPTNTLKGAWRTPGVVKKIPHNQ